MQTFIVNGSPRRQGATATLVHRLRAQLRGEVTLVEAYYAGVFPCTDCRYCWTHPGCAIDDGMQKMYRAIDMADNIVIASPIYFAELTGPLLSWASRLQYLHISQKIRGVSALKEKHRHGAVVLVDGGMGYWKTAETMGKRLLQTMGAVYEDFIYYSGTDIIENPLQNTEVVQKIDALAASWNSEISLP